MLRQCFLTGTAPSINVMGNTPTKLKFDKTMNGIVVVFMILFIFILIGLVGVGTSIENGDSNAGSMLAVVYMFPLIPSILLSLGLIQVCKKFLQYEKQWIASLIPIIFIISSFWLKSFNIYILTGFILVIVIYSLLKPTFKKLVA